VIITDKQRQTIDRIITIFECNGDGMPYDDVTILPDGPGKIRQVTYGKHQTTEYDNLRVLLYDYVRAGGKWAEEVEPYLPAIGGKPLVDDETFIELLHKIGHDPIMQQVQDKFFDIQYFQPASRWADAHRFTYPLSMLVIYDTYIHNGHVLWLLRKRFTEKTPDAGGDEKKWVEEYTKTKFNWLFNHVDRGFKNSSSRSAALYELILSNNWQLELPIVINVYKSKYTVEA
jgi:chitosanase